MRKTFYLIITIMVTVSCKSGLSLITPALLNESQPNIETYSFEDFDIYVFNICEKFKNSSRENRFCECPENFYEIAMEKYFRKVEELYLLKHKKTNLVIYLTTFSHKYISSKGKGFLNDPKFYKNNIVLDQIEYAYIGRFDEKLNIIHFPSHKDDKDIILQYEPNDYPQKLFFRKANIATAENNYDVSQPIILDKVFKEDIVYKKRDFQFKYYHGSNKMSSQIPKEVDEVILISRVGKVELVFGFENFERYYKMSSKRIKYHPNFYLIQRN